MGNDSITRKPGLAIGQGRGTLNKGCDVQSAPRWSLYFGDAGGWLDAGKVPIFNPVKHLLLDVTVLGIRGRPDTSLQAELEN
jgi:hypothetical protein